MKNLITILCLCLFCFSCDSPTEPEQEGVQLQWIGCDHCGEVCGISENYDCLWYIDTVPELSDGDEFESQTECIEIVLFQSDGYFNFQTVNDPDYNGFSYLVNVEWIWEEK